VREEQDCSLIAQYKSFTRYEVWVDELSSRRLFETHHRFECNAAT